MVTQQIEAVGSFKVTVDETKFTPEFLAEFSSYMFPVETVEECIEHLADLFARGVVDNSTTFIEGYGPPAEMGIKFEASRGGGAWIDNEVAIAILQAA